MNSFRLPISVPSVIEQIWPSHVTVGGAVTAVASPALSPDPHGKRQDVLHGAGAVAALAGLKPEACRGMCG